jgi:hypothetical protein
VQFNMKFNGIFILFLLLLGTCCANSLDNTPVLSNSNHLTKMASLSDPFSVLWLGSHDENFSAVAGIVGAVFVAGSIRNEANPPNFGRDIILRKYTSGGELVWNHTWQTSYDAAAFGLVAATDALYIAGQTDKDDENENGLLMKMNFIGNQIWNVSWGNNETECFTGITIGDGVYVSGYRQNSSTKAVDAVLVKFDLNGNELWNVSWDGDNVDYGSDLAVSIDGVYLVGWTSNQWSATSKNTFLTKFSPSGVQVWNTTWGGSGNDAGWGVTLSNKSIYVTGETQSFSSGSYSDLTLLKYNSSGSLLWNITDSAGYYQSGCDLINSSGSIYVAGKLFLPSIGWRSSLLQFDTDGTLIWKRYWGGAGNCDPAALAQSVDGLYIAGATYDWLTDDTNGFLVKYNSDGSSTPGPIELLDLEDANQDGTFTVSWTEAIDPDGTIDGYELQMARSPLFSWYNITWTTTQTTFTVTDRTDGLYYFRVRARDNDSLYGPWSNIQGINITTIMIPSINPWLAPIILAVGASAMIAIIIILVIRRWRIE